MEQEDEIEEVDLETRFARWFKWPADSRYRRVVFGFLLASAAHLWIADTWQEAWIIPDLILAVGVGILFVGGGSVGWLLCAVGLAIPIFFLRDQLTQSMLMLMMSLLGLFVTMPVLRRGDDEGASEAFLRGMRWLTIATYGLATFHKLNRDFLDPSTSCANYGIDELLVYYNLEGWFDPWAIALFPLVALIVEGGIAVAYLVGRRRIAWILAALFHIPITLTMAPAFALVMLPGHLSFVRFEDDARWGERTIPNLRIFAVLTVATTTLSLVLHGALPELSMIPKEALLWFFFFTLVWAFPPWTKHAWVGRPDAERGAPLRLKAVAWGIGGLFVLNGLTPYLGVQYQHTAAMLSNLRIDRGCWNHLIVPESVRIREDYVRVDEVYFVEPGAVEEYEGIVMEQLWSPPQILQMRRNWCRDELRPFYMSGTFRGRVFTIEDVCEEKPLPFPDDGVFDREVFTDFLRFQKNLMKECPQRCIH